MKLNKITLSLASILLLGTSLASASPLLSSTNSLLDAPPLYGEPLKINVNAFDTTPAPGTDGITALIYEIGLHWQASSLFTDDDGVAGLSVGDSVVDSGIGSGLYLDQFAQRIIGLNENEGASIYHQLRFRYDDMSGKVAHIGEEGIFAHYTSGTIRVFGDPQHNYLNPAPYTYPAEDEILRLKVYDSAIELKNALIFATVDYVRPNTFFFDPDVDWQDLSISARIDSNIDVKSPLVQTSSTTWVRTGSRLDGSVSFKPETKTNEVPEPGALSLLGLAVLGLGAFRHRRKPV